MLPATTVAVNVTTVLGANGPDDGDIVSVVVVVCASIMVPGNDPATKRKTIRRQRIAR